jgi:outer membrane protein TolC
VKGHPLCGRACIPLGVFALASATACVSPRTRSEYDEASETLEASRPAAPKADPAAPVSGDEASLSSEAKLEVVERLAVAHNPDLAEVRERVAAGLERGRSEGHWPDPELKSELWGQPLDHPVSFGQAETIMIGLRQTIPALGSVDARARVGLFEANLVAQTRAERVQEILAHVRRAYATYFEADREKVIHLNHVELATDLVELARANYAAGKGTQQDILRLFVELSKMHKDSGDIEQHIISSRTELNALMGRSPDAPLGAPADLRASTVPLRVEELEKGVRARRPEFLGALTATQRSQAVLDEAKSRAHWPDFMVGLDYWFMPQRTDPRAYGAMVSMTLPWLNPAHAEETRAAEHELAASKDAVASVENVIGYELRDAVARVESARLSLTILEKDLLPQARQSFEATRASFAVGATDGLSVVDAFRSYLDVRLEHERARARLAEAFANVERAAGSSLTEDAAEKKASR